MTKTPQDEISTRSIVKEALSGIHSKREYAPQCMGVEACLWEKEKKDKGFFSGELLKIIGIVYTLASPIAAWLIISVFTMQSDIKLIQQRQEVILEIKADINTIRNDLQDVKQNIAVLKSRTP